MQISVKLKPRLVSAESREALLNIIIGSHGRTYERHHRANKRFSRYGAEATQVRVYNLHKINAKYLQLKYKHDNALTGAVKGRTKSTKLVRKGMWIAYVYDIDIALLKAAGLVATQYTRNFTIKEVG